METIYKNFNPGTLEGALDLVTSGDTIATAMYGCEPTRFMSQLHTVADRVHDVYVWTQTVMEKYPVLYDTSLAGRINVISYFYNDACRKGHTSRRYEMVPMNLHTAAETMIFAKRPTIYVVAVSMPDENGNVYASLDLEGTLDLIEAADKVIFEINSNIPKVYGDCIVPLSACNYYFVAEKPLPIAPEVTSTAVETAIAENVASLVHDGDCIQLGIGGMPNAVGEKLMDKHDLGIHTEMITRSMGKLIRAGVVTNARKNINTGITIGCFAWGDQPLYDLMRENPSFRMCNVSYVNNPFIIAQNDNMVSINAALACDVTGQIVSETIGIRQFTGTGGAQDFAFGAINSKGGRGIIAMPSTAKDGQLSRITTCLAPGAAVSIPRNIADYVVTEYGIAPLRNRSVRKRVENLIAIAHPDFRAELRKEAEQMMLW